MRAKRKTAATTGLEFHVIYLRSRMENLQGTCRPGRRGPWPPFLLIRCSTELFHGLKLFHVEQLCWGIHVLRDLAENNAACDCCMWGCPLFQGLTGDRSELLRKLFLRVKKGAENCIVSEALRGEGGRGFPVQVGGGVPRVPPRWVIVGAS